MGDIFGADFLTNPKISEAPDMAMADLGSIDLPTFGELKEEPKLMPKLSETGPIQTSDGLNNFNAEPFFQPAPSKTIRMNEEHIMKEKYEILRKFERLSKLGVPMRKRFTLDSPIEEMKMELEFIKREKAMDQTIKQFCDWYITGMSALEWSSKNVAIMQAFGLKLDGLSESAQMNVADMEEDFEELYDLYGDKLKMHPLVRIPIRTCMMVYMVHLTNQMAQKSPIPNIDQILKTNPDIARQLATAAMQQQSQAVRGAGQIPAAAAPPPPSNPLAGLSNFMNSMMPPPPPQQTNVRPPPTSIKSAIKMPKPQAPQMNRIDSRPIPGPAVTESAPQPTREMKMPQVNIDDLLKSVNANISTETKKVNTTPKKGGSTGKNSVTIKL
jgi:hypothetical protein